MSTIEKGDKSSENASVTSCDPERRAGCGLKAFYYRPVTQIVMLGFVCFMCPGLYNALNGLGGGGRVDTATNANSNATHYATFAFFAFFAG